MLIEVSSDAAIHSTLLVSSVATAAIFIANPDQSSVHSSGWTLSPDNSRDSRMRCKGRAGYPTETVRCNGLFCGVPVPRVLPIIIPGSHWTKLCVRLAY